MTTKLPGCVVFLRVVGCIESSYLFVVVAGTVVCLQCCHCDACVFSVETTTAATSDCTSRAASRRYS